MNVLFNYKIYILPSWILNREITRVTKKLGVARYDFVKQTKSKYKPTAGLFSTCANVC